MHPGCVWLTVWLDKGSGQWLITCAALFGFLLLNLQFLGMELRWMRPVQQSCEECAKLMKVWDAKGLLDFFASPVEEGLFCRVFNAFKNDLDRQIGDRRRVNMSELSYMMGPLDSCQRGQ